MALSQDKHHHARILARRDVSRDLCIWRIDPGGPFAYRAGQYATLGLEFDGVRTERAYSLVSSPYEQELEVFVHKRSEEHTSELQSRFDLVCRLLLEKKKKTHNHTMCKTYTVNQNSNPVP